MSRYDKAMMANLVTHMINFMSQLYAAGHIMIYINDRLIQSQFTFIRLHEVHMFVRKLGHIILPGGEVDWFSFGIFWFEIVNMLWYSLLG